MRLHFGEKGEKRDERFLKERVADRSGGRSGALYGTFVSRLTFKP
jgi:hypothetical protein